MAQERILSTVMIEPKDVVNDAKFWNYFLSFAFLQMFRPEKEKKLKEYIEKKYPVDCEWVEKFAACAQPEVDNVEFVKMLSFYNMPGNIAGSEIYFYKDAISYTRPGGQDFRFSSRKFLKRTKKWSAKERLLICPHVMVEKQHEKAFIKVLEDGLTEVGVSQEDVGTLAFLMLDCCKDKKVTIQATKTNAQNVPDKGDEKFINRWCAGFFLTVLLSYFFEYIFKSGSWIGTDGLKRVMVEGFQWLPLIIYVTISVVAFWIFMYKEMDAKQKNENLSFAKCGKKGLLIGFLVALPVMILAVCGAVALLTSSVYALVDYNEPIIESVVLNNPTFTEDDGYSSGRYGNKIKTSHACYKIESENIDFVFKIPSDEKVKKAIETHQNEGVTVYYYKNSHVVQSISYGREIIIGE